MNQKNIHFKIKDGTVDYQFFKPNIFEMKYNFYNIVV